MSINKKAIVSIWRKMKKYVIELTDELSSIYQDITKMNQKSIEESLAIILERVIRTMLSPPGESRKKKNN